MTADRRWQRSILDTARSGAARLPWAGTDRRAWRRRCHARALARPAAGKR